MREGRGMRRRKSFQRYQDESTVRERRVKWEERR
jgi:hypothetical protein